MCAGGEIVHDGAVLPASPDLRASSPCCFAVAKADAVRRFECDYLQRVLHEAGGNVSQAARLAGKERRAFGKLLKKHGLAAHVLG